MKNTKLKVRLNHNRWLVDCPNCNGAEIVKPGEKFICYSCYPNARGFYHYAGAAGRVHRGIDLALKASEEAIVRKAGREYEVEWPGEKERIEKLVFDRPRQFANWLPGETAKDLERENAEHKINELKKVK